MTLGLKNLKAFFRYWLKSSIHARDRDTYSRNFNKMFYFIIISINFAEVADQRQKYIDLKQVLVCLFGIEEPVTFLQYYGKS